MWGHRTSTWDVFGPLFSSFHARCRLHQNLKKHVVSFEEATTVFFAALAITFADPDDSTGEGREITIGHTMKQRLAFVTHCERGTRIRLISARLASKAERRQY